MTKSHMTKMAKSLHRSALSEGGSDHGNRFTRISRRSFIVVCETSNQKSKRLSVSMTSMASMLLIFSKVKL